MAYKKYHYRGGKRYGPYYYESYRDSSGRVRKKYLGAGELEKNSFSPPQISGFFNDFSCDIIRFINPPAL